MKKIFPALCAVLGSISFFRSAAQTENIKVTPDRVHDGYFVKKVWLRNFQAPDVSVKVASYNAIGTVPKEASTATDAKTEVMIGMERKRPFAVIRVPAYSKDADGNARIADELELTIKEKPAQNAAIGAASKPTGDVTQSVLASGTWYKIGITNTGFHKIDADFVKSLGVDPSTVNPANIRVFGNGGNMLSEANYASRPTDLRENALLVSDGDNVLNAGDYAVFYGVGPMGWRADTAKKRFDHFKNIYSDTAYYFITFTSGPGLRINQENAPATGTVNLSDYNYYDVHDIDLTNPGGIGKTWYGEQFNQLSGNLSQNFNFNFGAPVTNVFCKAYLATTGPGSSNYNVAINGIPFGSATFPSGTTDNVAMQHKILENTVTVNSSAVSVNVTYSSAASSVVGYLNYIELNARKPLTMSGDQMSFRDIENIGPGKVVNYNLQNAGATTRVWDVTDPQVPVMINGSLSGSTLSFGRDASVIREFAAFNNTNLYTPVYSGPVANQNLHGSPQVDNIIVTYKDFLPQAERLAAYHRSHDNMRVVVVTPEQIYNEFSSGAQDISAIRDFVRMFYKRAGSDTAQMPRYLTLLGAASYDYKQRLPNNSNFVPVFESQESNYSLNSFSTDDFYGFLDDNENIEESALLNALDLGIGRLPARSVADADAIVNKIIGYKAPETLGPWRLAATLVADNNDGAGNHMQDAESIGEQLTGTAHNLYNQSKIYLDAIPTISTPAGARSPNANASITDRVYKGTMFINYNGHGNTQVWTEERILTQDDFKKWNNDKMLPFMVTATCDFGQFDHPQYVSAAEQLVLRNGGGVIAMLTTTAAVYANYNTPLNLIFIETLFSQNANGTWHSFGDAARIGKNEAYTVSKDPNKLANYRKFALLGDPALLPNFPEQFVAIDTITDVAKGTPSDTVKALGAYRISGHVRDNSGNVLSNFNGMLNVSFFDKPRTLTTITAVNKTFKLQDNLVYKGKVSVTNGKFSYTFIAPKDINYYMGTAKISHYAHNGVYDAAGVDTNISVGGYSDNPVISDEPPVVKPYINDSLFQNGGITGTNTSLFVSLYSKTGINVSGNKLGHDMVGILDGNIEQPYILNDYYETAPNTYQYGTVSFPINGLANGKHSIRVKAWDVNNNSGEGTVDFIVIDGKIMSIENLMNYPNPFSNLTHFVFEHNHPEEQLEVKINIYNTAGSLVKSIDQTFTPSGSRTGEITWDGTDNSGALLADGMYVYRILISTEKGYRSSAYQKLVIVR